MHDNTGNINLSLQTCDLSHLEMEGVVVECCCGTVAVHTESQPSQHLGGKESTNLIEDTSGR